MYKISKNISTLFFELWDVYLRARYEDYACGLAVNLYNKIGDQYNNRCIEMTKDEIIYLINICNNIVNQYSYDSLHPATKRGYKILSNKLTNIINK